jgi:hypothetical protein
MRMHIQLLLRGEQATDTKPLIEELPEPTAVGGE